jgi:hypothetical protein
MSALAGGSCSSLGSAMVAGIPRSDFSEEMAMRNRMRVLRDTLLVLGIQIVFRAMLALRRWNY